MEEAEWTTPKTKSSAASTNDEDAPFVLTFRPGAWLEEHAVDLGQRRRRSSEATFSHSWIRIDRFGQDVYGTTRPCLCPA